MSEHPNKYGSNLNNPAAQAHNTWLYISQAEASLGGGNLNFANQSIEFASRAMQRAKELGAKMDYPNTDAEILKIRQDIEAALRV